MDQESSEVKDTGKYKHLTVISINDIGENFIARKLLQLYRVDDSAATKISILDLISFENASFNDVSERLSKENIKVQDTIAIKVANALSQIHDTEVAAATKSEVATEFFNKWLYTKLTYLKDGDGYELKPFLDSIDIDKSHDLWCFAVRFDWQTAVNIYKENLSASRNFYSKMPLLLFEKGLASGYPGVGMPFLIKRILKRIQRIYGELGNDVGSITTRQFGFRHVLIESALENGRTVTMPSPLTIQSAQKPELMLQIEVSGLIDVLNYKIHYPHDANDIEIEYFYKFPPAKNLFLNILYGLDQEKSKALTEIQFDVYRRAYLFLEEKLVFSGRPKLEATWSELFFWFIKKVSYNLEDSDFLSKRYAKWSAENPDDGLVEDNFFLPFLLEKLKDSFEDRVIKKPEMFGGELDILFDTIIPVELKVRKGFATPLEDIINEHYKAHNQARAYAAKCRIGFVCVLDIPEKVDSTSNFDNCIQNFSISFGEDLFDTVIITCIFSIRLKSPSQ